jgi:hypothetical protein
LERDLDAIKKQGVGVAAISYDSVAVLKNFADRQHITFPLLSDPESRIIRAFGILNETVTAGTPFYGIPYPGTFVVDPTGKVLSKHFEDDYRERVSASDILALEFGQRSEAATGITTTKHLRLTTAASTPVARPGHRIVLSLDIVLNAGMHVYAPEVQGYIPVEWKIQEGAAAKQHAFKYPQPVNVHLEAIGETVPVYRGYIRIGREITFGSEAALKPIVSPTGELIVRGSFRYQACDERTCYTPETLPLEWHFHYEGLDRTRAPSEFQRKVP